MDLLVWIIAYKLSHIYIIPLIQQRRVASKLLHQFKLVVIKNHIRYFPLYPKKCSIHLPHILMEIKSTDFILRTLLITTNAVRFSIIMFSWQPLLSLLIFQFIYSARLKSKLNSKKYSHIVLRNCSPITEGDRSCSSPEKGVIIIFPIPLSIVFLNVHVRQTFMVGQQGKVINQS